MNEQLEGQMSIFDFINQKPEPQDLDQWLPCDTCGYDVKGCCDYNVTPNDYCVLGNKWISKEAALDDYIRENPTCFYVLGHYLDSAQGWHKVPEELPNFTTWQIIDVVLFGKQTGTAWMEHEKWEAKDWSFRSVDQRRDTETIEILAWKKSEDKTWNEQ